MNIMDLIAQGEGASPDDRDAFNALEAQKEQIAQQTIELAMMVHTVLTSGRGPELLDYLRSRTIDQTSLLSHELSLDPLTIPIAPEHWVFIREGENRVIRHLEGLIRLARQAATEPTNPPEGN
jgi:hypothetical protein